MKKPHLKKPLPRKMRKKAGFKPQPKKAPLQEGSKGLEEEANALNLSSQQKPLAEKPLKQVNPPPKAHPLEAEKNDLHLKYEELNKKYQFLLAEYANYKKQTLKREQSFRKYEGSHLIQNLIQVIDNFEMALEQEVKPQNFESFQKGIFMIQENLKATLKSYGVRTGGEKGEAFDPAFHNALDSKATEEVPPGHVLQVVKKAYFLHDRLIRPAEVIVSQKMGSHENKQSE